MSVKYDDMIAAQSDILLVAEGIRDAQQLANCNNATAPQQGTYGLLQSALQHTLDQYFRETFPPASQVLAEFASLEVMAIILDSGTSVKDAVDYYATHGFTMTDPWEK